MSASRPLRLMSSHPMVVATSNLAKLPDGHHFDFGWRLDLRNLGLPPCVSPRVVRADPSEPSCCLPRPVVSRSMRAGEAEPLHRDHDGGSGRDLAPLAPSECRCRPVTSFTV
jgi:hypothetical protein